jgi:hypothetical protein
MTTEYESNLLMKSSVCRLLKKISEARRVILVIRVRGTCSSEHEHDKRARFPRGN